MISLSMISLPQEALVHMTADAPACPTSGGNRFERGAALLVISLAASSGLIVALLTH